jgi:Ca2+-binding RTX toxin-like protein
MNYIFGGAGNDVLLGTGGDDYFYGCSGADVMIGGPGNDFYLIEDLGDRIIEVAGGRDIYWVDNAGDRVVEGAGATTDDKQDAVWAFISIGSLFANVEDVVIAGTGNLNANGNALDNHLVGNDGANVLNGGAGNDTIYGDAIYAAQSDDRLTGGTGSDTFGFTLGFGWGSGADTITDFDRGTDKLRFDNVGDQNGDHVVNLADLFLDVTSIVDHGAGHDVTVSFTNGNTIAFNGAGTGGVHSIADLVASPTQIETH